MATLFISDLHLEDSQPERTGWLMSLLDGPARDAEALYILGDLFEYWIGDDAPSETARVVAGALSKLAEAGVPSFFIHGNRDFLLGAEWAAAAGITLLPESRVVDLHGTPTLLMHGDSLCTDDVEYQKFRMQARNPAWQAGMLALPVAERIRLAREARDASMQHTGSASMDIMDVNQAAVRSALIESGVHRMIHGHTHRPARHELEIDGRKAERIVLADWYEKGSYLEVDASGCRSRPL